MPKQVYTWGKVQTGDIISFRYTGKKSTGTLTTLLVLNPRIPFNKKDGSKSQHLVGLKLESRGNVPTIRAKPAVVQLLENIGNIELVSADDGIYRLNLPDTGPRGVKKDVYRNLKRLINQHWTLCDIDGKVSLRRKEKNLLKLKVQIFSMLHFQIQKYLPVLILLIFLTNVFLRAFLQF